MPHEYIKDPTPEKQAHPCMEHHSRGAATGEASPASTGERRMIFGIHTAPKDARYARHYFFTFAIADTCIRIQRVLVMSGGNHIERLDDVYEMTIADARANGVMVGNVPITNELHRIGREMVNDAERKSA